MLIKICLVMKISDMSMNFRGFSPVADANIINKYNYNQIFL